LNILCAKLLGDSKEFDLEFFPHYYTVFARSALKDIWRFMYTSSIICMSLAGLGVRNALWSRRTFNSSPIFEISLNAALLNTLRYPYNTPEHRRNTFLALNLAQG